MPGVAPSAELAGLTQSASYHVKEMRLEWSRQEGHLFRLPFLSGPEAHSNQNKRDYGQCLTLVKRKASVARSRKSIMKEGTGNLGRSDTAAGSLDVARLG